MTTDSDLFTLLKLRKGINMLILYTLIMVVIVVLALRTWTIMETDSMKMKNITPTEIVMYTLSIYLILMIVNDLVH